MPLDSQVSKLVADGLDSLSPTLLKAVGEKHYFITSVTNQKLIKGSDGIVGVVLETYTMIDAERQITLNPQEHLAHRQYLYNFFENIYKWYEC